MKKFAGTFIALSLVGGLVALTVLDGKNSERKARQKNAEAALFQLRAEDISSIEVEVPSKPESHTRLEKKDGVWQITAPLNDRADSQELGNLTSAIEAERGLESVVEGADIDWKTYGLVEPGLKTKVTTADGRVKVMNIGSVSAYDGNLYARREGENKVVLVAGALAAQLQKPADAWRDKHVYRGPLDRKFVGIKIVSRNEEGAQSRLELEREGQKAAGKWILHGSDLDLQQTRVDAFVEQVKAMRLMEFKGPLEKPMQNPKLEIQLMAEDKSVAPFRLSVGALSSETKDAQRLSSSSDLSSSFTIYGAAVKTIDKRAAEFFDPKAPFKFQVNDATHVELEVAGEGPEKSLRLVFDKKGTDWVPVATSAKDAAHQAPLTNPLNEILTRVASLEAVRFLEPKAGASSKAKFDSHLILKNVKNEIEFKLDWVNRSLTHEPATADRPEAVYVLAHTNRSTHDFGLPEKLVKELGFENLKAEASAGSGEKNKTEVK